MQAIPSPLSNCDTDAQAEDQEAVLLARVYESILKWPQAANAKSDHGETTTETQADVYAGQ